MKNGPKATALLCGVILVSAGGAVTSAIAGGPVTVPGWPAYIAMGGIGGPDGPSAVPVNISSLSCSTPAGTQNDDFQGAPVDVVFKYAGYGQGDAGIIVPPFTALAMTGDLNTLSGCNSHPTRVSIVEYTSQYSGGEQDGVRDLTDTSAPGSDYPYGNYIMARHLITLGADAMALAGPQVPACTGALQGATCNGYAVGGPVMYNNTPYYGTLILNPDLLGTVQQNSPPSPAANGANWVADANNVLSNNSNNVANPGTGMAPGGVNMAVDIALCFLTNTYSYTNTYNPNGGAPGSQAYDTTYTGTAVGILEQMLADGFPPSKFNSDPSDPYWPYSANNLTNPTYANPPGGTPSQVSTWFDACASNPTYNTTTYQRPSFANTLNGWVQANNWLIRAVAPKGTVTFGWEEGMFGATGDGDFWLQTQLTSSQVASTYSGPTTSWLQTNTPDVISSGSGTLGANYVPDYFAFDRFGEDDSNSSAFQGGATLYNAQSWDNYLTAVGQISTNFNNIPIMMWQIPGSHIPNTTETSPEYLNGTDASGGYVFSTAPVYFFGDRNLTPDLSNIITGTGVPSTAVGNFNMAATTGTGYCGPAGGSAYNCPSDTSPYYYSQWLLYYQGQPNNYDWSKDNGKLAKAAANNVFAIVWGAGGAASNVVANSNSIPDNDHGWLANKIITYYGNPTPLTPDIAHAHDFNADSNVSDILWRDSSGNLAIWLMSGGQMTSGSTTLAQVPTIWTVVGSHDFNRDGSSDILWLDNTGNLGIWLMNGTSVLSYDSLGNVGTQWSVTGTGDFNGDRNGDILWRNTSTGELAIWLMNGDGQFSSGVDFGPVPLAWTVAGTGDFNGDGTTDILWRNTQTGDLAIWLMNNQGQLLSGLDLGTVPGIWSVVGTGDFNGDGTSDILWRDTSGNLAIWIMGNGQMTSGSTLAQVPLTWSVSQTGDFDGDGKSDILWSDTTGDLGVWLMNGVAVNSKVGLGNVGTSWQPQGKNSD